MRIHEIIREAAAFKLSRRTYTKAEMNRVRFPGHLNATWTPTSGGGRANAGGWKIKAPADDLAQCVAFADECVNTDVRIDELISVRKYKNRTYHDVLRDFQDAGGEVSSGSQGHVLSHPRWNYVLKAFPNDPEYLRFVRWAKRRQDLVAVPRVLGGPWKIVPFYARRVNEYRYLYVVKLERLHPITDPVLRKNIGIWVDHGIHYLDMDQRPDADDGVRDYIAASTQHEAMTDISSRTDRAAYHAIRNRLNDLSEWRFLAAARQHWMDYPGLRAVCEAYAALVADNVAGSPDLHGDNFMLRENGAIVMIDPLWAGETPYQAHDAAMRSEIGDYDEPDEPDEYNTIPGGQTRAKKRPRLKSRGYLPTDLNDMPF
jgi:hypothetical protein